MATANSGVNILEEETYDLSDGSGEINSVAISAGDFLQIQIKRDSADTSTEIIKLLANSAEVSF